MSLVRKLEPTTIDKVLYNLQHEEVNPGTFGFVDEPVFLDIISFTFFTKDRRISVPEEFKTNGVVLKNGKAAYQMPDGRFVLERSYHVFYIFDPVIELGPTYGVRIRLPNFYEQVDEHVKHFESFFPSWKMDIIQENGIYFRCDKKAVILHRNADRQYRVIYQSSDYPFHEYRSSDTLLLLNGSHIVIRRDRPDYFRYYYYIEKSYDQGMVFHLITAKQMILFPNGLLATQEVDEYVRWSFDKLRLDGYYDCIASGNGGDWYTVNNGQYIVNVNYGRVDRLVIQIIDSKKNEKAQEVAIKHDLDLVRSRAHPYWIGPLSSNSTVLIGIYLVALEQLSNRVKFSFHFFDVSCQQYYKSKKVFETVKNDYSAWWIEKEFAVDNIHLTQHDGGTYLNFSTRGDQIQNWKYQVSTVSPSYLLSVLTNFINRDPGTIVQSYLSDEDPLIQPEEIKRDAASEKRNTTLYLDEYRSLMLERRKELEAKAREQALKSQALVEIKEVLKPPKTNGFLHPFFLKKQSPQPLQQKKGHYCRN